MQPQDPASERAFLSGIAIFGGLEAPALDRLIAMVSVERFPVGAAVCRQDDAGRCMYVVRAGEVVVCRGAPSGKLVRMVRLGPGEFFGEMTLIDPQPRSATVFVEAEATLYGLTNKDLYALYREDVHAYVMVLQNICRQLSRRLRQGNTRISELADDAEDETTQITGGTPGPKERPPR